MTAALSGVSSMATRQILAELGAAYAQRSGCRITITSIGGVDAMRRISAGEVFDIIVLAHSAMDTLAASGHLVDGSRVGFARSFIAVAVRSGEARPRIRDEQDLKQAVLQARRISYSSGPSGDHLKRLLERWGIAETLSARLVQAPPGVPVGSLLARGEADLGFQQMSELLDLPGIDILGLLPSEVQSETLFAAGIGSRSSSPDEARALIAYLTSPETGAAKRRHGLEPA